MQERRQCGIPLGDIHKQMSKSYSEAARGSDRPAWINDPEREKTNVLEMPFAAEEIRRQLRRLPANSAPGPDGTTYAHWKRIDPEGKMLTVILNICRKAARVPSSWKKSTTVLAYKNKGDEKDLRNWRPTCLQNIIYKIYAATIAKRIATWAIDGDVINTVQKGFLLYEGCFEHIFLLRLCLKDAHRKKRKIGVVGECVRIGTDPTPSRINGGAGTHRKYCGSGKGYLHRFNNEGEDRHGPFRGDTMSQRSETGLPAQPDPL